MTVSPMVTLACSAVVPFEHHTPVREPVNGNANPGPSNPPAISQQPSIPALFDAADTVEKVIESFKRIAEYVDPILA